MNKRTLLKQTEEGAVKLNSHTTQVTSLTQNFLLWTGFLFTSTWWNTQSMEV